MKCPKCQFEQDDGLPECPKCGVVFAKLKAATTPAGTSVPMPPPAEDETPFGWRDLLLTTPADGHPLFVSAKGILLALLFIWGCRLIFSSMESNAAGQSVMHLVNLPFHEAGHILFSPLGKFIKTLGGSLAQVLMPAICLLVLLLKTRDAYGAAVAQWWLGESFLDLAPYINDARALKLILLGGVTGKDVIDYHDWEYLLRQLGMLAYDHALAWTAHLTGAFLMLAAFAWGAANVWVQWQAARRQSPPV